MRTAVAKKKLKKPASKKRPRKKAAKKTAKKKTAKKTAKKKTAKKKSSSKKKQASAIAKEEPRGYFVKNHELRLLAARDYIFDPDQCSVEALYDRPDRPYSERVALRTFKQWSYDDGWAPRRDQFWQEHEMRVYEKMRDQLLRQKLEEIRKRTEERDAMAGYLRPKRDLKTGEILYHDEWLVEYHETEDGEVREVRKPNPLAGLPVLPLEVPRYDQFVNAFVKFDQHLMGMRGEATSRTEHITRTSEESNKGRISEGLVDPVAAQIHIDDDDIDQMAKALLRRRQPELTIDAEWEDVDDDDEDEG